MTHDYKRNGTTSLFAAMNVFDGTIIGECLPQHRHQEWLRFLNLIRSQVSQDKQIHLVCDNYATHKHPKVLSWAKPQSPVPLSLHSHRRVVAQHGGAILPRPLRQSPQTRQL